MGSRSLQCRLESKGLGLDTGFRRYDGVGRWTAIFIAMTIREAGAAFRNHYGLAQAT